MTDPATLRSVLRPVREARGLPNAHYLPGPVQAEERQRLFHESWAALAFADDVPERGDAVPLDFLGAPLLLLRGRDGRVRVFHNVCRHRGMILVAERRNIQGAIRCPYHSWCYGTDGALKATPHVGGPGRNAAEGIERAALGLIEVRSALWRGIVVVNLSGEAPPIERHVAAIEARWPCRGPFVPGGAASRFTLEVACNWKLAVENYCESYHLPWIHPGLNSYSRLEDHYDIVLAGAAGQGTRAYRPTRGADALAVWPGMEGAWLEGAEYLALFPNLLLGQHRDHAFAIILAPDGPERTREHVALQYAAPPPEGIEARLGAMWREVFEEDIFVVEGMQRGRHAPAFDGGRFSPAMDGATHAFHAWVARRLLGEGADTGVIDPPLEVRSPDEPRADEPRADEPRADEPRADEPRAVAL